MPTERSVHRPFHMTPSFDATKIRVTFASAVVTFFALLSGFIFGYNLFTIVGLLYTKFKYELRITYSKQQLIYGLLPLGAALSCCISASMNDIFGRRCVIIFSSLIFVCGDLISGYATTGQIFALGRFVSGAAIGISSVTVPLYISECAPTLHRGKLLVLFQLSISSGSITALFVSIAMSYTERCCRTIFYVSSCLALVQILGMALMPESPRWLALHCKLEKSHEIFVWLQGGSEEGVEDTIRTIEDEADEFLLTVHDDVHVERHTVLQIFQNKKALRALALGFGLHLIRQMTGFDTIAQYTTTLYNVAGETYAAATWLMVVLLAIQILMNCIAFYVVDKYGRNMLMRFSLLGCIFGLFIFGYAFWKLDSSMTVERHETAPEWYSGDTCSHATTCMSCCYADHCGFCYNMRVAEDGDLFYAGACLPMKPLSRNASIYGPCKHGTTEAFHWSGKRCPSENLDLVISNLGLIFFFLSFSVGVGPLTWVVSAEIFPTWARSTSMSLCGATGWTLNCIMVFVFIPARLEIPHYVGFFIFASFSILGFLFLLAALKETRYRMLEDMDDLFLTRWHFRLFKI